MESTQTRPAPALPQPAAFLDEFSRFPPERQREFLAMMYGGMAISRLYEKEAKT